ncbi:MAG: hypothetical protein KA314_29860 [Chloroflexi bacterium]|nr:hypothetical protein [Chloroflexota bacterium]
MRHPNKLFPSLFWFIWRKWVVQSFLASRFLIGRTRPRLEPGHFWD